ncbi:MAG: chorismate-binding protein, partial [Thermoanaerobaculia bacterium]
MNAPGERERFLGAARPGGCVAVARAFPSDELTPVMLFRRMRASGRECFLLESVEGGETIARYTFLGCGPSARLTIRGQAVEEERGGVGRKLAEPPLAALARLAIRPGFRADPALPPLCAGAVGYLGYDAVRLFEEIPDRHARDLEIPDGLFLLFDACVAFDHPRQSLLLLTGLEVPDAGQETAVDAAIARLDELERFLGPDRGRAGTSPAPTAPRPDSLSSDFAPVMPRQQFLDAVAAAKEHILAGDIYQVVLSQRWTGPLDVDPFEVYRALRMLNPSPYLFYLETREAVVFGSSPEMLVRCRGRSVETRPIAGTVPRGATQAEDA